MTELEEYYNKFNEEKRLNSRHGRVEFITSMKYIHDCLGSLMNEKQLDLRSQIKILDVGAGTGRYSVPLAEEGYDVTALELVKHNLGRLKQKSDKVKAYQGNATKLKKFGNDEFDLTLVFGPMYHLKSAEEKLAADPFVWQYAAAWFARRKPGLSEQMCEHYSRQLNTIILPVIGSLRMSEVTTDSIADVMATRAHLGRSSQRDTVQTLKQIFSAAADADVIRKDPTRTLKPGGKKPPQKKALTKRQEEELLSAVAGLRAEGFVRLGLFAGLRREEICGLLWDCVFESDPTPHIIVCRACRWPQHSQPEISDQLKSDAAARSIPIPHRPHSVFAAFALLTPGAITSTRISDERTTVS